MEVIEELSFTLIKLIILIIGVVFLFMVFSGVVDAAYEQIAFANVEKLKAAIDEACFKGATSKNPIEIEFELPQRIRILNVPALGALTEALIGGLVIRSTGDPAYVVYYEMFPVSEGISWEVYHKFGYRTIGMLRLR